METHAAFGGECQSGALTLNGQLSISIMQKTTDRINDGSVSHDKK